MDTWIRAAPVVPGGKLWFPDATAITMPRMGWGIVLNGD